MGRVKNKAKRILGIQREGVVTPSQGQQQQQELVKTMVDVLFINGCDASVPHPPRYRVTHQREQLEANNVTTDEIYYINLEVDDVKYANAFVIFRCPYTEVLGEFIQEAKRLNKPVLFDIDDLVIATEYTDQIKYVQQLNAAEKEVYDDGVIRMGKTLALCDGAITTTKALATELSKFVPEVYINRNTASDEMYQLSQEALKLKEENETKEVLLEEELGIRVPARKSEEVRIGYFSGSITHNADVRLIMPALAKILEKYPNARLYVVGELDLPDELKAYESQVVSFPFMDWKKLPRLISMVDINLAPLEDDIFNCAKSENKWVEAALVNVVTVASDVGAFQEVIEDGVTGFLCKEGEWFEILEDLVLHPEKRECTVKAAHDYVCKKCITTYSGRPLAQFMRKKLEKTAVLVLPSTEISGGIMVALKHIEYVKKAGYNVTVLADNPSLEWIDFSNERFPVVSWHVNPVKAYFQKGIATLWTTTEFLETHPKIKERYYLVQGFETDLYEPGVIFRGMANRTYSLSEEIRYMTVSKWCQKWLKEDFGKEAEYVPNGMVRDNFPMHERSMGGKIRILIEGDSSVSYKGVDESFRITNQLDSEKFEVWYMSYNGQAKEWYRVDRFFHRIPYNEVGKIYGQCDILLKSSWLESFSYPPLEMMATGGYVVAVANGGNVEYLENEYNCLFYEQENYSQGIECIERILHDDVLRRQLMEGARATVAKRDWESIREDILKLYQI